MKDSSNTGADILPEHQDPKLTVVQQPLRSRVCGFSPQDRRPVLPPPVVKLSGWGSEDTGSLIIFASLWSPDCQNNVSYSTRCSAPFEYKLKADTGLPETSKYSLSPTSAYTKSFILMGNVTSVGYNLKDQKNEEGLFFVFPEVAIRSAGRYKLRFDLYNMPSSRQIGCGILSSIFSSEFQAYLPKDFPGTLQPTTLSKIFGRQGVDMRIPT
ncbi:velvet factor [Chytriomyces sp. MP71]|nr:velvet factor [Chytriomyces sp. MP71]